jgi:hypothetical protein
MLEHNTAILDQSIPCCPWSHGLRPKKLSVSVAMPTAPIRVPSQRPLAPNVTSVTSIANDNGENEMIVGAVHRSPGICLTAEENLSQEIVWWRDCATIHRLKWDPFHPNEFVRIAHHVRMGEGSLLIDAFLSSCVHVYKDILSLVIEGNSFNHSIQLILSSLYFGCLLSKCIEIYL